MSWGRAICFILAALNLGLHAEALIAGTIGWFYLAGIIVPLITGIIMR